MVHFKKVIMFRVKKVFSEKASSRPYSLRVRDTVNWLSQEELISLVTEIREVLPKKVQIPFSKDSMPLGGMKIVVPIV